MYKRQVIDKLKNQNLDLKDIIQSNPVQYSSNNNTVNITSSESTEDMDIDEVNNRSDISDSEGNLFESWQSKYREWPPFYWLIVSITLYDMHNRRIWMH